MGLIDLVANGPVYLDVNILIYFVEREPRTAGVIAAFMQAAAARGLLLVTSELSLGECLVKPLMESDAEVQAIYREFIQSRGHFVVPVVDRTVIQAAAGIRAATGMKLPDAIHAATARLAGCSVLLTNDAGFKRLDAPRVIVVSEAIAGPVPE